MGIPHLITFLQPFAPREPLVNQHVVLDGPGFAHHVYYICLGTNSAAKNAFEAAPSYSELVNTAIAWLDALRDSKIKIEKIYFDGFLPPSKLDTRLSRLAKSSIQLSQYHTKYPVPCRATIKHLQEGTPALFGKTAMRSCLGNLPPSPFLVPAVLEALGRSAYEDLVEVVPGEADAYCAKYAHEHGGIILTGDSDLLVHDLGADGAVSFFKDIVKDDLNGLSSQIYRPSAVADRLALPGPNGLQFLAFEMFMDPHGTFPKLVAQAKLKYSFNAFPEMFAEFIKEYNQLPEVPITGEGGQGLKTVSILRKLDPRISEYVLQFRSLAQNAGQVPISQVPENVHVFLHFILDCPIRTNSWEISSATRQLAYGLINLIVPKPEQNFQVFEHRRQQNKSKGLELQLPSLSDVPEACSSLLKILSQIKENLSHLSDVDYWLAVAVYQEVEWAYSYAKPSLSEAIVQGTSRAKESFHRDLTWDFVHLLGQIHGCYYSFRILKQITNLVLACGATKYPVEIASLSLQLESLPDLSALLSYGDAAALVGKIDGLGMIRCSRSLLGQSDLMVSEAPAGAEATGKKRKRKRNKSSSVAMKDRKSSTNPFDLLDIE